MSLESRLQALCCKPEYSQALIDEIEGIKMLIEERDQGRLIECLDDGFVRLVDHMGDDAAIVRAARVSYGKGTKKVSDDRNLIRYLMRHQHETPFEMVECVFHVRVPMHCWRQWIRHRTASVNEYSTRYSVAINSMQTTDQWRLQSTTNRQGSEAGELKWPEGYRVEPPNDGRAGQVVLDEAGRPRMLTLLDKYTPDEYLSARECDTQARCRDLYEERLKFGVAREQARKDLPLSTYTEAYWKCDLRNTLHFLQLRMDRHAQEEIRTYSNAIAKFVKSLLPLTWEAFEDYRLNAMTLSHPEIQEIRRLLRPEWSFCFKPLAGREREEFNEKLHYFGLCGGRPLVVS